MNPPMSHQILFRNFELLEPSFGELRGGYELLIEGDTVKELSETPLKASNADVIDCGRRTLMPGLIDCHVHAIHSEVNVRFMEAMPLTLIAGLWGMNIALPHFPGGDAAQFWWLSGIMVAIVVMMLALFRRNRWI